MHIMDEIEEEAVSVEPGTGCAVITAIAIVIFCFVIGYVLYDYYLK